jgi:hypothetical protein
LSLPSSQSSLFILALTEASAIRVVTELAICFVIFGYRRYF